MKRTTPQTHERFFRRFGVIDLLQGLAVRAVQGNRSEYQRLSCHLTAEGDALELASKYREIGICDHYVADLDAITCGAIQAEKLRQIAQFSDQIWIDAGLNSVAKIREIIRCLGSNLPNTTWVIGLESLTSAGALAEIPNAFASEDTRLAFSLDLRLGQPVTGLEAWKTWEPFALARRAVHCGFQRLIVLDLAAVGAGQGCPTISLCREIRDAFPDVELITGGGVRNALDVKEVATVCDGVLLGSVLYDNVAI
jgi:phosphoribosylformimino-5-aminoimidazole carboxamide ribotide isomerase